MLEKQMGKSCEERRLLFLLDVSPSHPFPHFPVSICIYHLPSASVEYLPQTQHHRFHRVHNLAQHQEGNGEEDRDHRE